MALTYADLGEIILKMSPTDLNRTVLISTDLGVTEAGTIAYASGDDENGPEEGYPIIVTD